MNPRPFSRMRSAAIAFVSAAAVAGSLILSVSPALASNSETQSATSSSVVGEKNAAVLDVQVDTVHSGDRYELALTGSTLPARDGITSDLDRVGLAVIPRGYEALPSSISGGALTTVPVDSSGNFSTDLGALSIASASVEAGASFDVVAWPANEALDPQSVVRRVEVQLDPVPEDSALGSQTANGSAGITPEAAPLRAARTPAHAADSLQFGQPTLSADVEERANDGLVVSISGFGFEDVEALPGQTTPHVYAKLSKVGEDLSGVTADQNAISMEVHEGLIEGKLEVPVHELEPQMAYEVITWPTRSNPSEANVYARVGVEINWEILFPEDSHAPSLKASVSSASAKGLAIDVSGEKFTRDGAGVPVTLALALEGDDVSKAIVTKIVESRPDGTVDTELVAQKSDLDRTKKYRVIAYGEASVGEVIASATLHVSAEQWTRIFGAPTPGTVVVEQVRVVPDGLETRVRASNLPSDLVYVAIIERGTEASLTQEGGYVDFLYQPKVRNGQGSFTLVTPKESLKRSKKYEVLVWKSHSNPTKGNIYGRADLVVSAGQWDALQGTEASREPSAVSPTPAPVSSNRATAAGSLTWGISGPFADYTTNPKRAGGKSGGRILTTGVGKSGSSYTFPQGDGGKWNEKSQTGTVQFSGVVTFTAHKGLMREVFSNPSIEVKSESSATLFVSGRSYPLDLGAASKSLGANGEVTWSGVPVNGSISGGNGRGGGSFSMDPLTFTVGSASEVSYGTTVVASPEKKQYTAADAPPATTGVTVLTDADKITPGGRIEIEASGFDTDDEGVLVVLYSDPIVLDDAASADENGVVHWSGTLPKDVSGEHTITIQGSTNAGAVIDIVDPKQKKSAKSSDVETESLAGGVAEDRVTTAGLVPAAGGMALWEWWASAAGLVAIAACMTLLTIRQRRNAA